MSDSETTLKVSNSDNGVAVCKPVSEQDALQSIVLDEIPVLAGMYQVDWSHYINSMEKVHGKQN